MQRGDFSEEGLECGSWCQSRIRLFGSQNDREAKGDCWTAERRASSLYATMSSLFFIWSHQLGGG